MINYSKENKLLLEYCSSNDIASFNAELQRIKDTGDSLLTVLMDNTTKGKQSLVHVAVQQGSYSILATILEHSIKVNALAVVTLSQNSAGETPLHLACAMGDLSAAILLLHPLGVVEVHCRADRVKDNWGRTPWMVAVENGYAEKLSAVLEAPYSIYSDIPPDSAEDSFPSVQRDPHREMLSQCLRQDLLDLVAAKNRSGGDSSAVREVHVKVKTIFGEHSEQIQRWRSPPERPSEHAAVASRMLLAARNRSDQPAAATPPPPPPPAIQVPSPDPCRTRVVAASTAEPNPNKRSAISKHLEYPGDRAALQRMVAAATEFDINGKDMFGLSALHKLSSWDKPDLLAVLLKGGGGAVETVDVHSVTAVDGYTCMHCAVDMRALSSLEWLLRALSRKVRAVCYSD